jgi:hypothetical protein
MNNKLQINLSLYGSWIHDHLCNRCLSPLTLWVWMVRCLVLWCLTPLSTILQLYHCRSVLFVEETGVHRENYCDLSQVTDKFYHLMLYRVHLTMNGVQTHNVSGDRHRLHRWSWIQLPYNDKFIWSLLNNYIPAKTYIFRFSFRK